MSADRLERLTTIALRMHEGQVDKQGCPYSEHILAVVDAVSKHAKPVALFHDALEDDRTTLRVLKDLLTPSELNAVDLLTRRATETYADYIQALAGPQRLWSKRLAREVKIADIRHNLGRLTPELESLRARYEAALARLEAS